MIASTAGSLMATDRSVVVLDLTSHDVAEDLMRLVSSTGQQVPCFRFPTLLSIVDLFHELEPEAVGRVIADAFAVLPGRSGSAEIRRRDEAIVRTVARLIGGPLTFRRLAAGVRVLQRLSESGAGSAQIDGALSLEQQLALSRVSHEFGRTPQEIDELTFLVDTFEMLAGNDGRRHFDAPPPADEEPTVRPAGGQWRLGLTVFTAPIYNNDSGASARILLYRFMEDLRYGKPHETDDLIIVAGVDRLGRDVLDEFSQHAHNAKVRTMFLHQHVPPLEDAQRMLNTAGSVTLLMGTSNALQARAAVDLIGAEYRFVLSQETQNTSESLGSSQDETIGQAHTESTDQQRGRSFQFGLRHGERLPIFTRNSGSSRGTARTSQWARTRGTSETTEHGTSITTSRVFEPGVEPVEIETLPRTAFIALNKVHFREAVMGDCDPGICRDPRAVDPQPERPRR
ncbi:hypothetical protein [Frankia sp. R82]|uniref:hypothetical protein n=1 Tax=Frankia sp. R82 TaxID=2950553 RepID=UPI002042FC8B|nr:hypothetical protein [Frankia sp. R82]MCM3882661.1 hypothetical protein [Frankia sp. R82]